MTGRHLTTTNDGKEARIFLVSCCNGPLELRPNRPKSRPVTSSQPKSTQSNPGRPYTPVPPFSWPCVSLVVRFAIQVDVVHWLLVRCHSPKFYPSPSWSCAFAPDGLAPSASLCLCCLVCLDTDTDEEPRCRPPAHHRQPIVCYLD